MSQSTSTPKPDPLWGKPRLAYNVHAELVPRCRAELGRAQDRLNSIGPGLLRCPLSSLHVSLVSFLFVREEYEVSKELLWARHGEGWSAGLGEIVARLSPFQIWFTSVSVTDTAVIALAEQSPEIEALRAGVSSLRAETGLHSPQPSIVHSTLLRYGTTTFDWAHLVADASKVTLSTSTPVTSVVVSKELVYPKLVTEEVARLYLAGSA